WHAMFVTNWRMSLRGGGYANYVPEIFWSLSVEEQFYLAWPLVTLLVGRRGLLIVCPLVAAGAFLLRAWLLFSRHVPPHTVHVITPCRMDGLAIGAFLAAMARGSRGLLPLLRYAGYVGAAAILAWLLLPLLGPRYQWEQTSY